MTDLIIVESPGKVKTVGQYAGPGYRVRASVGHVRDLPDDDLGIDVDNGFGETYAVTKPDVVAGLKKAAKEARTIYLATDPDREGEAIAWHIHELLPKRERQKVRRITFQAITQSEVQAALHQPRDLDRALVDAGRARRAIDRLVGWLISPLLREWGVQSERGLSAGRVQTAALRIVVERERARRAFIPQTYYTLHAHLAGGASSFWLKLTRPPRTDSAQACGLMLDDLRGAARWWVESCETSQAEKAPPPPFTTASLQQAAGRHLKLSPRQTQQAAQELYEAGLVTYIRTDSLQIAPEAQAAARQAIERLFGSEYLPEQPPTYHSKAGAQEAHEAIRPTDPRRHPTRLDESLSLEARGLYRLIWSRFLGSQMRPALFDVVDLSARAGDDPSTPLLYQFSARSRQITFDGYLAAYDDRQPSEDQEPDEEPDEHPDQSLPCLDAGTPLHLEELAARERRTQPPPRFGPAGLVGELERLGIGRPSTYAAAVDTISDRAYVALQKRQLVPTPLGEQVLDLLLKHFPHLFDLQFTAGMEELLDRVAGGQNQREEVLASFYHRRLKPALDLAQASLPRLALDERCPQCGQPLRRVNGKRGPFLGCTGYPDCAYTRDLTPQETTT